MGSNVLTWFSAFLIKRCIQSINHSSFREPWVKKERQHSFYRKCSASIFSKVLCLLFFISCFNITLTKAQETMAAGSYIINMGVLPQTEANGLRPYGMVYDLLANYQVPIKWVINQSKGKDGVDFSIGGTSYRGGPFIIPAEFITATVSSRISFWQGEGVQGTYTTAPVDVPVYTTLFSAPSWTLNNEKEDIPEDFFDNASIPSSAYNLKAAADLDFCDDVFVMPHDDPEWSSHSNLLDWNRDFRGSIWYGCHAGGALENMFNPANPSEQTNFLCEKNGIATDIVKGYAQNTIIWSKFHDHGEPPYTYEFPTHPIMQFMGDFDEVPNSGGAQQVYIPIGTGGASWRPTTFTAAWDPDHPERFNNDADNRAVVMAFGRAFGLSTNGWVLMQAGHDITKAGGQDAVAAQRSFFNFSFLSMEDKVVIPSITGVTTNTSIAPGTPINLGFTLPGGANPADYTVEWTASCTGGTFSPSNTAQSVTFTPPNTSGSTTCILTLTITDPCNRITFDSRSVEVVCQLSVTPTITPICAGTGATGVIDMAITGGTAPYNYTWTRAGGGTGSGTGTNISGLSAGTYTVGVTASNGCQDFFTAVVNEFPAINLSTSINNIACFGQTTGSISLNVSGGTPGYTYSWGDGPTTQNRSGLAAGIYEVTVTDNAGCTANVSRSVTQPAAALSITPSVTNILCFGEATGAIALSVAGGTATYNFLWNDGANTQNRSNLLAGTYGVTVTDMNNCTETLTNITVTQPASALSVAASTVVDASCGNASGSISLTVSGGTGAYTYDWSGSPTGDGTANITNLGAGNYIVTVTDANGCSVILSQAIQQSPDVTLTILPTNPTCPPGATPPFDSDGAIDLTVNGGTAPFTYAWSTGDGSGLNATAEDQTGLTAGTYTIVVTDDNSCTTMSSVTLVNENELPVAPTMISNN